jgi:hypothetical protein
LKKKKIKEDDNNDSEVDDDDDETVDYDGEQKIWCQKWDRKPCFKFQVYFRFFGP